MKQLLTGVFLMAVAVSRCAHAQGNPQGFETASIKPSDPNEFRTMIRNAPGGRVDMKGVTLRMLIQQAYGVRDFQVSGGPGWMGSERYDVVAKPPDSAAGDANTDPFKLSEEQRKALRDQMQQRLQVLLAERFQLKIHHETKEMPVYALAIAKGGSKLKEVDAPSGMPSGPPDPSKRNPGMMRMSPGMLSGQAVGIQFLVDALSQQLGRTVLDQTGLKGFYDFELKWTPEGGAPAGFGGPLPPGVVPPPPPDPNGPTIYTAVQEQLGLRIDSQKGPVDILVIDRAEKPSEN